MKSWSSRSLDYQSIFNAWFFSEMYLQTPIWKSTLPVLSIQTQSSHMNPQNIRDKAYASPMRRKLNPPIGTDWICSVQSSAKSVLCCPQHTSLPSFSHIPLKSLAHWRLHLCCRNSRSTWTAVTSSLSCRPSMTFWNRLWGKVSCLFIK